PSSEVAARLDAYTAEVGVCEGELEGSLGGGLEPERSIQTSDRIVEMSRAEQASGLADQRRDHERPSGVLRLGEAGGAGVFAERVPALSAHALQLAVVVECRREIGGIGPVALEQRNRLVVALHRLVEAAELEQRLCAIGNGPGQQSIAGRELCAIVADRSVAELQRLIPASFVVELRRKDVAGERRPRRLAKPRLADGQRATIRGDRLVVLAGLGECDAEIVPRGRLVGAVVAV